MTILSAQHLSVSFHGIQAVKDFSVSIDEGECLCIMGPSGAGKSSVLRALAGLIPTEQGTILLDGKEITALPPKDRHMAMVFQSAALFPHTRIKDNITYGLSRLGYSKPEIEEKLMAIAEKMKISDQLNKYPAACSGGQNQRASIARALIRNPRILLLDEPLSSLDLNLKEELLLEIRRLCTEEKMTMIYVTHDRHEAEQAGDRIALMNEGRLLCLSSARELYDSPSTLEIAGLLGNEYQITSGRVENGMLYDGENRMIEKVNAEDGEYMIAWRNSLNMDQKKRFLLFAEKSGARIL